MYSSRFARTNQVFQVSAPVTNIEINRGEYEKLERPFEDRYLQLITDSKAEIGVDTFRKI